MIIYLNSCQILDRVPEIPCVFFLTKISVCISREDIIHVFCCTDLLLWCFPCDQSAGDAVANEPDALVRGCYLFFVSHSLFSNVVLTFCLLVKQICFYLIFVTLLVTVL